MFKKEITTKKIIKKAKDLDFYFQAEKNWRQPRRN